MYCHVRVHRFVKSATSLTLLTVLLSQIGCEPRRQSQANSLPDQQNEFVLTLLLDLSGSYGTLMAEDGQASRFTLRLIDRYFRDRVGTSDKIIIGQLSGSDTPLLFEGTPLELRRRFPSADAFGDFLVASSHPGGSRIHDGIADAIDYLLADSGVSSGKTQSAVLVLSDMLDNVANAEASKTRLLRSLTAYGQHNGSVGLYWVNQSQVIEWRSQLQNCGIQNHVVESEIVTNPPVPSFE